MSRGDPPVEGNHPGGGPRDVSAPARAEVTTSFPTGDTLDQLLTPGQFVFVDAGGGELVCGDRAQLMAALERWSGDAAAYFVRWKRADGSLMIRRGPLPAGWGIEP